jgi:hypothetical protein
MCVYLELGKRGLRTQYHTKDIMLKIVLTKALGGGDFVRCASI